MKNLLRLPEMSGELRRGRSPDSHQLTSLFCTEPAAVATPAAALPSTSRSRSRPPRGAVGLGPLPADLATPTSPVESSNRTLIESLARSLSRPRQSSSSRPRSPTSLAGSTLTREQWLASNGGQPWGALGMGARSPERRDSTSRGRTSNDADDSSRRSESQQSHTRRREWSVSRREWVQAGSSSAASAFEVLTGSGEKSTSSSRSASPDRGRGRRGGVVDEHAAAPTTSTTTSADSSRSQSRARAVLDKVRRGLMSPRSSSQASLAPAEADEVEPIVPKSADV